MTLRRTFGGPALVREVIGTEHALMLDANQVWGVDEAIDWMSELAEFQPLWIEEPTSPDDILGHARIARGSGRPWALAWPPASTVTTA